jgi:hypothetical protein
LRSEYDPDGPLIRINSRIVASLPRAQAEEFIAFAIGHELHHHREHCGQVTRLQDRAARETAANAYARALLSS